MYWYLLFLNFDDMIVEKVIELIVEFIFKVYYWNFSIIYF